ncbi:hypothetical protein [Spirillospora sp. NPDC047279]|uniref:hypothetical protein n=1 Tax=Spirillospora sp. NPDC047279 TaxID=3155478 RepID=UPI003406ED27
MTTPGLDPLVLAAGQALDQAMATQQWTAARTFASELWAGAHPERVPMIEEDLAETRAHLLAARGSGDRAAQADLVREWQLRLGRLVRDGSAVGDPDLRLMVRRLTPLLPPDEEARVSVLINANARGRGRVYAAGRDMHVRQDVQQTNFFDSDVFQALVSGKGPGRLLGVLGVLITCFFFAGWASLIMTHCGSGPDAMLGRRLPSGVQVGVVYFLGFGAGGLIAYLGASMAKSRGAGTIGHWVVVLAVIAVVFAGVDHVLGGAPLSTLYPDFGPCQGGSRS